MPGEVNVTVDRDFARFGSKAYAINKINTVDVVHYHPRSRAPAVIFGLLALGCLGAMGNGVSAGNTVGLVICSALAVWLWQRANVLEYRLMLATSSGAVQALTSRDRDQTLGIRDRIERAIAGRLDD
jgi:hypothetical protein